MTGIAEEAELWPTEMWSRSERDVAHRWTLSSSAGNLFFLNGNRNLKFIVWCSTIHWNSKQSRAKNNGQGCERIWSAYGVLQGKLEDKFGRRKNNEGKFAFPFSLPSPLPWGYNFSRYWTLHIRSQPCCLEFQWIVLHHTINFKLLLPYV